MAVLSSCFEVFGSFLKRT